MSTSATLRPRLPKAASTPSEIAVTQAAYPDRIKTADYAPKIAPIGPIRDALDYRARFPDGRPGTSNWFGDAIKPSRSKSGEKIDGIVALTMAVGRIMAEPAPKQSIYETEGFMVI